MLDYMESRPVPTLSLDKVSTSNTRQSTSAEQPFPLLNCKHVDSQNMNKKYILVVFCVIMADISVFYSLTLVFSSLFDYTSLQAGLITLKHLRK